MFTVEEAFQITGRGTVVSINGTTNRGVGKSHTAEITRPDGTVFKATCYKEWLLRRHLVAEEREGYLLMNVEKVEVPIGSKIKFNEGRQSNNFSEPT